MKKTFLLISVVIAGVFLFNGYLKSSAKAKDKETFRFNIRLAPLVPRDTRINSTPAELCTFAWNQFFALNWESAYNTNTFTRGQPNLNWDYSKSTPYPDVLVWETYAHRTELRPASNVMLPFNKKPYYSFKDSIPPADGADQSLFNNLDENNEIGSCNVYAHADKYQQQLRVLYQAKCNQDEYEYVKKYYSKFNDLLAATTKTANNIAAFNNYYKGAPVVGGNCNCPDTAGVVCLPCGDAPIPHSSGQKYDGAIEVKTGWRPLVPEDKRDHYLKRTVIVYEERNGKTVAVNKEYGLIGIHIIHKTTNYPDFIFATWEHEDVYASNMEYYKIDTHTQKQTGPPHYKYARINAIAPVVDSSTAYAHRVLKAVNNQSIWQYYRLVGVQGYADENKNSFNYFLANYVIESDSALQLFHGNSVRDPFNGKKNLLFGEKRYLMGGCKGCHGVAQIALGGDMSFLMDTIGKPVKSPDTRNEGNSDKLKRYINAFQMAEENEIRIRAAMKKKK